MSSHEPFGVLRARNVFDTYGAAPRAMQLSRPLRPAAAALLTEPVRRDSFSQLSGSRRQQIAGGTRLGTSVPARVSSPHTGGLVSEIVLADTDRLDWAIKNFRRKVQRSGVLGEVRKRRHYLKPSIARRMKQAAAQRRRRADARKAARDRH